MSSISIIGTGNMARAIGALAVTGGNTVEVIGRDQSKAADLAKALGSGATAESGAPPLPATSSSWPCCSTVSFRSSPSTETPSRARSSSTSATPSIPTAEGLAIPDGTSIAQEVRQGGPGSAIVVKAFNTIFRDVLAAGPARSTSSSPAMTRRPKRAWQRSSRASGCARWTSAA